MMSRSKVFRIVILAFIMLVRLSTVTSMSLSQILDGLGENFDLDNVTEKCRNQMLMFQENWKNPLSNPWALEMVDASSKLPSGVMSLNVASIGNFDQCIRIKANGESKNSTERIFGKYCLGFVTVDKNKDIENQTLNTKNDVVLNKLSSFPDTISIQGPTWSMCIPNACSAADINHIVHTFTEKLLESSDIDITFNDFLCQTEKEVNPKLTTAATVTLSVLAAYFCFLLISTVYDVACSLKGKTDKIQSLIAFSVFTNTKKLFKISKDIKDDQIPCLNGLRFISIVWVVAGHQYSITAGGPITNTGDLIQWSEHLYSMFLVSGTISVDTFLVIGGALISYTFLKCRKIMNRRFNLFHYYLHRYVRLTPPMAVVVLISSTLLTYMGSGPRWPLLRLYFQGNCEYFWWTALLYVQNYVNVKNMCVGQGWYLDIDMQLYIISPIFLFGLIKWPKKTLGVVIFCALLSMAAAFEAAWRHDLTAVLTNIHGNAGDFTNEYYLLTHTRATPWFIGFTLGYFIFKIKTGDSKQWSNIKQLHTTLLWLFCLALLLFCALIGHGTLRSPIYDKWGNVLHITFIRPVWSLGICWIILASVFDKRGFISQLVNGFLSLPIFQVLNRFTYSIYLTHVTMMYLMSFAKKSPEYFSDVEMAHRFWGTLWFSLMLSFVWVLAFESPTVALEKIIWDPTRSRPVQQANDQMKEIAIGTGAVNFGFQADTFVPSDKNNGLYNVFSENKF